MAVKAKIQNLNENEIEKERMRLIKQGAPVLGENPGSKNEWHNFTLRIKNEMLKKIEDALENLAGMSKTGFILQAIQEKLKRVD